MKALSSRSLPFLSLAMGLALLVRLPGLGESFWYDEVFYTGWNFARGGLGFLLRHDVHPPLYTLVMRAWTGLFGDREWVVRVPSLLFGLATLPLVHSLARRWLGLAEARVAVLILALSPAHIWYSQENKVNMLAAFLTTLMVRGLQTSLDRGWRADWALFAAAAALALWSHSFALPVVAVAILWLWWRTLRDTGRPLAPATAVTLAAGLAILPLAWQSLAHPGQLSRGYLRPFTAGEVYRFFLNWLPHGNTLAPVRPYAPFSALLDRHPGWFLVDVFFALLLLVGVRRAVRTAAARPERGTALLPLWLLLPPAALLALSLVHPKVYIERNLLVVLPPFAIILAAGLLSLKPRPVTMAAGVLLAALQVTAVWNLHVGSAGTWTVYKPNPDWRSAATWLRRQADLPGGVRVVLASSPEMALRFYLQRLPAGTTAVPRIHQAAGKGTRWIRERLRESRSRAFFLVHELPWPAGFPALRKELVADPAFRVSGVRHFAGVDIHRVELTRRRRSGAGREETSRGSGTSPAP